MSATAYSLERGLPSSIDAERSIIGAVLLDNLAFHQAAESLSADDFSLDSHRRIYARMQDLSAANRSIDLITLAEELSRNKEVEAIGGVAYLSSLTDGLPHRPNIEQYVRIVRDKALLRGIVHAGNSAIAQAMDEGESADTVLASAEAGFFALSERAVKRGFSSLKDVYLREYGTPDAVFDDRRQKGLLTHFLDLDNLTGGLQKQDLIVLAGRPSMGKSAISMQIGVQAAQAGAVVGVFSLEMSARSLLDRTICSLAKINLTYLRDGLLSPTLRQRGTDALGEAIELRMFVDDTPGLSISEMRAKARRLKHQHKRLDLIVVDYLQKMATPRRAENRNQAVGENARGLKDLAKELECPVIAVSQLSRACETREDKRPQLSDLRESGDIEQEADVVGFMFRPEYYSHNINDKGKAELGIAKQRNGPTDTIHLAWLGEYCRFENAVAPYQGGQQ